MMDKMPKDRTPLLSQLPTTGPSVSPEWLRQQQDTDLVIADCRFSLADPKLGYQQYLQGHIPGSYYLDLNQDLASPVQIHGGRHPLPDIPTLTTKLSHMGVTAQTTVIAYDDSRFAFASRLWWLLKYLGHPNVAVLEGGFAAYQAAGLPISTDIPLVSQGQFTPNLQSHLIVDIHGVQQKQQDPNTILLDSRESDRFRGEREPIDPIAGHIPGAVNYPWQQVSDENGKLRSPQDLKAYWSDVAIADHIVVYCGSGVTACVNLLALEAAEISTAQLYVGSWSDWCSYPLDDHWQANLEEG
jgi:thiosulfate/3-mercaptopyruvate sulfurtransferase